jgi:hypothetical protein
MQVRAKPDVSIGETKPPPRSPSTLPRAALLFGIVSWLPCGLGGFIILGVPAAIIAIVCATSFLRGKASGDGTPRDLRLATWGLWLGIAKCALLVLVPMDATLVEWVLPKSR